MQSTSSTADWRADFCSAFVRTNTVPKVLAELRNRATTLGFSHCSFGMRLPLPIAPPPFQWVSNSPVAWQLSYISHSYVAVDPTVRHGLTERLPLVWSADRAERDA